LLIRDSSVGRKKMMKDITNSTSEVGDMRVGLLYLLFF
jgi:hypothetical protein